MKDYFRYIIVLALITVLCTGFVSAAGSGTATENNRVNETIQHRFGIQMATKSPLYTGMGLSTPKTIRELRVSMLIYLRHLQ